MFNHLSAQPTVRAQHCSAAADRSESWLAEFDDYMVNERGLSIATRRGRRSIISRFLSKMVTAGNPLTGLTIRDVDAFLQSLGEQDGYSRASLQMVASCLRPFLRYGAIHGWCRTGLAEAIKSPRVYSLDSVPIGPSWEEVRRLLALTEGKKPTDIRARAILMLLAIYGLRAGEVKQLRLDDFDWNRELLSVSHSKSRRTRIFPLSRPVGDAVLLYIRQVRPRTRHREVFLTLDGRPLKDIYMIVSPRLRRLQTDIPHHGPHALRHACATHLLAEGCSLKQIGDQLGHQDADSTRIYAKVDISGLRKVGDVDLGGLL
ncbi:MAG: tyrosine-type recombinase/integrase [Terriglobia bacterium]